MSDEMTPAVEAVARVIALAHYPEQTVTDDYDMVEYYYPNAREALTAALTDPDDPDMLARTLYVLDSGQQAEFALRIWFEAREDQPVKQHWRAVADGLCTAIFGSD